MIILYGNPHGRVFHLYDNFNVYMETGKKSPGMPVVWANDQPLPSVGVHEGQWVADMLHQYSEYLYRTESELY